MRDMKTSKLLLYGDSNTYGYDPRGMLGMRYPEDIRWTTLVSRALSGRYDVIAKGMNGRELPSLPRDVRILENLTDSLKENDIFFIMLGTNDILLTNHPDASVAVNKMEKILGWIKSESRPFSTIVIGPPLIEDSIGDMRAYHVESRRMNDGYEKLCSQYGVTYYDAAAWNVPLTFDGVHISEEGQEVFAQKLLETIGMIGGVHET